MNKKDGCVDVRKNERRVERPSSRMTMNPKPRSAINERTAAPCECVPREGAAVDAGCSNSSIHAEFVL